jgi:hypothetical protein
MTRERVLLRVRSRTAVDREKARPAAPLRRLDRVADQVDAMTRGGSPPRARGFARLAFGAALLAAVLPAVPAAAQESGPDSVAVTFRPPPGVLPLLPAEHWAVRAAARLEAMGLAPGYLPAQRAVPRSLVARALDQAAESARTRRELAAMVKALGDRFADEFPEFGRSGGGPLVALGSAAGAAGQVLEGRLEPAYSLGVERQDPRPLGDDSDAWGFVRPALGIGRVAAVTAEVRQGGGAPRVPRWDVIVGAGAFSLAVGRETMGYGPAVGGGITLSSTGPMTRVELQTARPVRLGFLGEASLHTFLSRFDEARQAGDPYFWGMRAALRPHPRLTLGLNRGSIFGGDSAAEATAGNVLRMLVGVLSADFENQVVSVDGRWRLPTEGALPLSVYFEWGADDGAGAWWDVPGIVAGAFAPALPGLPQVGVGAEVAYFSAECCGNGPWYTHSLFRGGWVREDVPLGHPLGGEGREVMVYTQADLFDARLRLDGRVFARRRDDEGGLGRGNLFFATRRNSTGGAVDAAWRLLPRLELRARYFHERGDGWREQQLRADFSYLF